MMLTSHHEIYKIEIASMMAYYHVYITIYKPKAFFTSST